MNYFELFEISPSIKIDQHYLSDKYFELQKKYHPDNFVSASDEQQFEVLEKSAQINKAIKTLKNEDATIQYILQLKDLWKDEEKYELQTDFLMEMMELNESLMEIDSEEVINKVNFIKNDLRRQVSEIINNYEDKSITTTQLLKLKDYYFKKKYLQRILDRIVE